MKNFNIISSTFTPTIFSWSFYSDFTKIADNTLAIKIQLSILGTLLREDNIEQNFLELARQYPEVRGVLPILLAVRHSFWEVLDEQTKEIVKVSYLFNGSYKLNNEEEEELLKFFRQSGLRDIFESKKISNLNDYVFGIETGLDSNARKNRSGTMMEKIVGDFVRDFCEKKKFEWKEQATAKWMLENWGVEVRGDKHERRFDFAIYNGEKVYLFETNFYGGGGSKLKAVAGEFSELYRLLKEQKIELIWITDGEWWQTTLRPLEDAYNATEGHIYNISMLKSGILENIIQ